MDQDAGIAPKGELLEDLLRIRKVGQVDAGGPSWREFAARAIDPDSGRREGSYTLYRNIAHGHSFKPTPEILRALAVALDMPPQRVQAAASRQYLGLYWDPIADLHDASVHVAILGTPDMTDEQRLRIRATLARVLREIEAETAEASACTGADHDE